MPDLHYLDANASEPLRPEAKAAVMAAFEVTGNPSSVHAAGRRARALLEDAREKIAGVFGARAQDLVFTSGGTEADALAVHGLGRDRRIAIGATEHDAIRATLPLGATLLPVDHNGVADLDVLRTWLMAGPPALVCLMAANNETGTLQPVAEAAALCRAHGALLHVDAAQAAGRITVDLASIGCHSLAVSAHKLGGPGGVGALLLAPEVAIDPLIAGGGQELGRRGGTQAVAACVGFAAVTGLSADQTRLAALRDRVEAAAVRHGAVVCGGGAARLANTTSLALPGVRADTQVIALDLEGIAVSAGAACSSGKVQTSHVLTAMGLGALAGQAIRVSLPWNVSDAAIDAFEVAYARMADRSRRGLVSRAA